MKAIQQCKSEDLHTEIDNFQVYGIATMPVDTVTLEYGSQNKMKE